MSAQYAGRSAQVGQLSDAAGIHLDERTSGLLAAHLEFILEANERVSLTAIRTFEDGLKLHILDSLMVIERVQAAPAGPVLDMGSGGGYPGIPIAITTGRSVTLVDSVGKKMRVMQEFIDAQPDLQESVTVATGRLEALGDWVPPGGFGAVVARALSSLPSLVELAAPLLSPGGHLICMKGDLAEEELKRGNRAAHMVGLSLLECVRYTLPGGDESRSLVVYARTGKPRIAIPRREGMAQRKPLA